MNDRVREYEKTGYLLKHYRLFHLRDTRSREFEYHYHDFDKFIYFISGKADYMIEGKKYSLEPHDIILVNRNEIHKPMVDFSIPYERIIIYIEHDFIEGFRQHDYDLTACFGRTQEEKAHRVRFPAVDTRQLYETLCRMEKNDKDRGYAAELYGEILFLEFMIQLNRACIDNKYAYHPTAKYNKKIIDIIQFINENLAKELSIDKLAEQFYMSKYHMMRQFKEETGYSIHQYISEKRLLAAKTMILKGTPATTAALECGFRDYSTFARAFKKKMGCLPSEAGN